MKIKLTNGIEPTMLLDLQAGDVFQWADGCEPSKLFLVLDHDGDTRSLFKDNLIGCVVLTSGGNSNGGMAFSGSPDVKVTLLGKITFGID